MHSACRVRKQDSVSDDTDRAKEHAEQPALLCPIRKERSGHVRRGADKVARHRQELYLGRTPVAKILDDSW